MPYGGVCLTRGMPYEGFDCIQYSSSDDREGAVTTSHSAVTADGPETFDFHKLGISPETPPPLFSEKVGFAIVLSYSKTCIYTNL